MEHFSCFCLCCSERDNRQRHRRRERHRPIWPVSSVRLGGQVQRCHLTVQRRSPVVALLPQEMTAVLLLLLFPVWTKTKLRSRFAQSAPNWSLSAWEPISSQPLASLFRVSHHCFLTRLRESFYDNPKMFLAFHDRIGRILECTKGL